MLRAAGIFTTVLGTRTRPALLVGLTGMAAWYYIVLTSIVTIIQSSYGTSIDYSRILDSAKGLQDWIVTIRR